MLGGLAGSPGGLKMSFFPFSRRTGADPAAVLFAALLLAGALGAAACGAMAGDDVAAVPGAGAASSSGNESSGSASGSGGSTTIYIAPDAGSPPAANAVEGLCGKGVCQPGSASAGCADAGAGGAGGGGELVCKIAPTATGEPCRSATDCAADLGCVGTGNAGVCRPYCCGDPDACPVDTYCALGTMVEDDPTNQHIPICTPASNCMLLVDTGCPMGETCTIVRADGTTSCVTPGTGTMGQPCPCAAGYVCSGFNGSCQKLCQLGENGADCTGGGKCQGGVTGYPAGFGVCIAGS
jgi:hypothetical protein